MSSTFANFGELGARLQQAAATVPAKRDEALVSIGKQVVYATQAKMGTYQPDSGNFPGWQMLSLQTIAERIRLGFSPDDPLRRTGALANSYTAEVEQGVLAVGSPLPQAKGQEFGIPAKNLPARPAVGPAMQESGDAAGKALLSAVQAAFGE